MKKVKYKWLLFDADGTLLNYDQSEKFALLEAFKTFHLEFHPEYLEKYREINARLWSELEKGTITSKKLRVKRFELLFDELNFSAPPDNFGKKYLEALGQTDFVMEGAHEVLTKLNRGTGLAIITNGIKEVQHNRLNKSNLADYFKHIIVSEEAGVAKPDKLFFDYTLGRINFHHKEEILVIGDSLKSDILGGNLSGIDTCWYNPQGSKNGSPIKPTYEISRLADILGLAGCNEQAH